MATIDTTHAVLAERVRGDVFTPGDEGYDAARTPWNLAVDQHPEAVVVAHDAADVAATVRFAAEHGFRVAPQGTGHGAAAIGDLAGTILLRTTAMRGVEIDPVARRARVAAGTEWQEVVAAAARHGLAALHGSSPDVGVVGYTLGGGMGWYARAHGFAANRVTAIELVLADGSFRRVDRANDPELFWALRGGGSFGIVTALEFDLLEITQVHAGWLIFPWQRSREVLKAWSAWTRTVPESVTSVGRILQLPPIPAVPEPLRGRNLVVVEAAMLETKEAADEILAPLRALGPEIDTFATVPQTMLGDLHADPPQPVPGIGNGLQLRALPDAAVTSLVEAAGPNSGSPLLSVEIRHLGGALGREPEGAGARAKFDAGFAMFALGVPMGPGAAPLIGAGLEAVAEALEPWRAEVDYTNFSERPSYRLHDVQTLARLAAVRRRVDPGGLIRGNHTA
jgi:hypothetical protein